MPASVALSLIPKLRGKKQTPLCEDIKEAGFLQDRRLSKKQGVISLESY